MKNEAMAKAVTQIDDGLIAEAYEYAQKSKTKGYALRFLAAAACMTVVVCAVFASFFGEKVKVCVDGAVVSDKPIAVSSPQGAAMPAKRSAQEDLSVLLEIESDKRIRMESVDGEIRFDSSDNGKQSLENSGSFSLVWTVKNPEIGQEYTLKLDHKTGLTLSFDESLNNWTIKKYTGR